MSPTALQNGMYHCDRVNQQYETLCADEEVEKAKVQFVGAILQQPPMYSAVSIKGERLYRQHGGVGYFSSLVICEHA